MLYPPRLGSTATPQCTCQHESYGPQREVYVHVGYSGGSSASPEYVLAFGPSLCCHGRKVSVLNLGPHFVSRKDMDLLLEMCLSKLSW